MVRSQRRHLADRIAKRRHKNYMNRFYFNSNNANKSDMWWQEIGRFKDNKFSTRCTCLRCTTGSAKKYDISHEDEYMIGVLMSEKSLSKDWLKPEEDEAWKDL